MCIYEGWIKRTMRRLLLGSVDYGSNEITADGDHQLQIQRPQLALAECFPDRFPRDCQVQSTVCCTRDTAHRKHAARSVSVHRPRMAGRSQSAPPPPSRMRLPPEMQK